MTNGAPSRIRVLTGTVLLFVSTAFFGPPDIFKAIRSGNAIGLHNLLRLGANANAENKSGWTPLMAAAYKGDSACVTELLHYGAKPYTHDSMALIFAVQKGNLSSAQALISAGAYVNCRDDQDKTAVQIAIEENYPKLLDLLLHAGADQSLADEWSTPMCIAIDKESPGMVKALLSAHPSEQILIDALRKATTCRDGYSSGLIRDFFARNHHVPLASKSTILPSTGLPTKPSLPETLTDLLADVSASPDNGLRLEKVAKLTDRKILSKLYCASFGVSDQVFQITSLRLFQTDPLVVSTIGATTTDINWEPTEQLYTGAVAYGERIRMVVRGPSTKVEETWRTTFPDPISPNGTTPHFPAEINVVPVIREILGGLDEPALQRIALASSDLRVRIAAVGLLNDEKALERIAENDEEPGVREAAISRLNTDHALGEIGLTDKWVDSRIAAVTRLRDANLIARISTSDPDHFVRQAAQRRLEAVESGRGN